jgi:hypothetical protein
LRQCNPDGTAESLADDVDEEAGTSRRGPAKLLFGKKTKGTGVLSLGRAQTQVHALPVELCVEPVCGG